MSRQRSPLPRLRGRLIVAFGCLISLSMGGMLAMDIGGIPGTAIKGKFEQNRLRTLGDLELVSGLISQEVRNWFMDVRSDLRDLSASALLIQEMARYQSGSGPAASGSIENECRRFLANHPNFLSLALIDHRNGHTIAGFGAPLENQTIESLKRLGGPAYPENIQLLRQANGTLRMRISWHLMDARKAQLGILLAEVSVGQAIVNLLWNISPVFSTEWRCQVYCQLDSGYFVMNQNRQAARADDLIYPVPRIGPAVDLALHGVEGPYDGPDTENVGILSYNRSLSIDGGIILALSLSIESAKAFSHVRNEILNQLVLWLILIIGVILVGGLVTTRMTRPIRDLMDTARRIEAGDLTARAAEPRDAELGQLPVVFNAMIGKLQTWNHELETRIDQRTTELLSLNNRLQAILFAVPDIMMEVDTNKVYIWGNQAGLAFFGPGVIGRPAESYFEGQQDTLEKVDPLFRGASLPVYVESWQRRQDGSVRLLAWWCQAVRDHQGRVTGTISTARDITDQRADENRIIQALREKETLLREVYHRTKNTLQVIQGLLTLQAGAHPDNPDFLELVRITEMRIRAISLVHQMLYRVQDLSRVSIKEYGEELATLILHANTKNGTKVHLDCRIADIVLPIDLVVPLGLIINELLTNSLKYAWPHGQDGQVTILIQRKKPGWLELSYQDDGEGLASQRKSSDEMGGLGLKLVRSLGEQQLQGSLVMEPPPGGGFGMLLVFALPEEEIGGD